ncbi:MAG: GtrA family protein [Gammaproteobacteria bacterium]|jgi:putative flippase GtrA
MLKFILNKLPKRLLPFAVVGAFGFVLDASILSRLIFEFNWDHYTARIASFGIALPFSWFLNRIWTFRNQASDNRSREYSVYVVIQTAGALLNFSIYGSLVFASAFAKQQPVLPLAIASICAMLFNFYAVRRFAFTGSAASEPAASAEP